MGSFDIAGVAFVYAIGFGALLHGLVKDEEPEAVTLLREAFCDADRPTKEGGKEGEDDASRK